ncbi:hypothetical protein CDAR_24681 [Caerostris darwini]|uniref:Uncharacterized protein n=1 Tax=Caerostris darwini TaxID=1538125 RepID=A0AAV4QBG6_9ARAC|nr:hypothetical protein CDAR_24681 [Caerostris darwini]
MHLKTPLSDACWEWAGGELGPRWFWTTGRGKPDTRGGQWGEKKIIWCPGDHSGVPQGSGQDQECLKRQIESNWGLVGFGRPAEVSRTQGVDSGAKKKLSGALVTTVEFLRDLARTRNASNDKSSVSSAWGINSNKKRKVVKERRWSRGKKECVRRSCSKRNRIVYKVQRRDRRLTLLLPGFLLFLLACLTIPLEKFEVKK